MDLYFLIILKQLDIQKTQLCRNYARSMYMPDIACFRIEKLRAVTI
jgi:hypothetical protein